MMLLQIENPKMVLYGDQVLYPFLRRAQIIIYFMEYFYSHMLSQIPQYFIVSIILQSFLKGNRVLKGFNFRYNTSLGGKHFMLLGFALLLKSLSSMPHS